MSINKKAQTWSIDTIIAFFIFFGALSLFLIYLGTSTDNNSNVNLDAKQLPKVLNDDNSPYKLFKNNKLDSDSLSEMVKSDYDTIKNQLGIQSDFCIYITDKDGNLININEITGDGSDQFSVGSDKINLTSEIQCGS